MKLKGIILCVIVCSVIAVVLQIVGLAIEHWMYAPSVVEFMGGKNITFYSLRGLWHNGDKIYKYKIAGKDGYFEDMKYAGHTYIPANVEEWFDAVRSIEVVGMVINVGSMVSAIVWYFFLDKGNELLTSSTQHLTFISLILGGFLDLLGVTILIGKLEPALTSWAGALCGFAGTFSIIGAGFIRHWHQEKFV